MASTDAAATRVEQAVQSFQQGRQQDAIAQLREICTTEPDNAAAWFHCGEFLLILDRAAEAEAPLLRATELAPGEFEPVMHLAQARHALGKMAEAMTGFERAVELMPDSADAWVNLGLLRYNADRFAESALAFEKSFSLQPDLTNKPGFLRYYALAVSEAGRWEDALPALDRALAALPEADARHRPALLLRKGTALNELGKFSEARAILQEAAALSTQESERALILMQLAAAQSQLHEFAPALDSLDRALALPSSPAVVGRTRTQRAAVLNALGRAAEAEPDAATAIATLANDGSMSFWRLCACLQRTIALDGLGRFADAVAASEVAVREFASLALPGELDAQMKFYRGLALRVVGRAGEAVGLLAAARDRLRGGVLGELCSFQLAVALNQTGDHAGALRALAETLELRQAQGSGAIAPGVILLQQVLTLVALKRAEEAVAMVDGFMQSATEPAATLEAWKLKADVLCDLGRGVDLLAPPPPMLDGHPFVLAIQGSVLVAVQRHAEAAEKFRAVTWPLPAAWQPQPLAWLGAGMALLGLMRASEANDAFARVCEIDSQQATPLLALLRGQALVAAGRHEEALKFLADAPEQSMTWLTRGIAHASLKQTAAALHAFERTLQLAPASDRTPVGILARVIALTHRGFVLLGDKRLDDALHSFEEAVAGGRHLGEGDPNRMLAQTGLGLALVVTDRVADAEAPLREAAQLSQKVAPMFPRREVAWWALGIVLLKLQRDDEAAAAFTCALAIEPRSADAMAGRAQAYLAAEDHGAAERDFRRAADLAASDDDRLAARIGRGQALMGLELHEQAVMEMRQAVPLLATGSRGAGQLWLRLGEAYRKLGRFEAASRALRRGFAVEKSRSTAVLLARGLSAVLLEMKRPAEARDFIAQRCGWISPDSGLDYNLGIAHHRLKNESEAALAWKRAAGAGLDRAREVVGTLHRGVRPATGWIDFWWGEERGWVRRVIGVTLATLLVGVALLPLLKADAIAGWLNTGQSWEVVGTSVAVLVGLLLAPSLNKFSFATLDLELNPSGTEGSDPEAELEALLEKLPAIETTALASAALSGGVESGRSSPTLSRDPAAGRSEGVAPAPGWAGDFLPPPGARR